VFFHAFSLLLSLFDGIISDAAKTLPNAVSGFQKPSIYAGFRASEMCLKSMLLLPLDYFLTPKVIWSASWFPDGAWYGIPICA